MIILAIDPGITTGVAVIDSEGTPIYLKDLRFDQLNDLISISLLADIVVIEEIPIQTSGKLANQLSLINQRLREMFPDAEIIRPGIWKPVMAKQLAPGDSPHQRDAYRIAEYVRLKEKENG